ncbi:HAD family phosphatase [Aliiroseovarius sp. S1339]|uniref:HAD family hydrolase n=1 Tax=Aliiroseovarius sp. S1339 TaxID=2936990 RepID=UPI0020BE0269|nr:HAD family phosphatase [Aliiroseovarius sp. S1339]MCK8463964.1 HAD family phosphatase [Aliiroseovarius sp. S1339]
MTQTDPAATQPNAVIFDIGNVLIRWQPEDLYDQWIGPDRRRQMFGAVDLHAMNDRVDRGEGFRQIIYETADAYPQFRTEILLWHDRWLDMAQPAIDLSVKTLHALKARNIPVFALSNFGRETFELAEAKFDFLSDFDRRYISGHMGVIKPEVRIYEMVEEDCGVPASDLLFVDDRADNITAAAQRGWQTHHFTDPQNWVNFLITRELINEADL